MAATRELKALIAQAKRVVEGEIPYEIPDRPMVLTLKKKLGPTQYRWHQIAFNIGGLAGYHNHRAWRGDKEGNRPAAGYDYPDATEAALRTTIPSLLRQGYQITEGPEWR